MRTRVIATILAAWSLGLHDIDRAAAAPKPEIVPSQWQLDIKIEQPEPIQVYMPGRAKPETFWYVRYKLTNRTGVKQIFVPEFLLYTNTGQVLRAGKRVPSSVFNAIKTRHNVPLLRNMTSMTGVILHGADNSKLGVAIWPDFDPEAGRFDIFIGGLSGETAEIDLPRPIMVEERIPGTKKARKVTMTRAVLTKTLRLTYSIPGEAKARINTPVTEISRKWMMR